MKKADLHVHSRFSEHPSEWFLQRLGTRESYTSPEDIYAMAMRKGMSFVTITDHNEIAGSVELKEKYPFTTFTGVESTAYFPEDGCKVHVLVYGLTEAQFSEIEKVRSDIYKLRDYLKEQCLAHSVAHATYSVNKKLTSEHIEKLLLLFDYFETANGARTRQSNSDFFNILIHLNPDHFETMRKKYRIEPFSDEPWRKGFTGGSDDHCGLTIGDMYTSVKEAATPEDFLEQIAEKVSFTDGNHGNYARFAFSVYKIAYEFSKDQSPALSRTLFPVINRSLFGESQSTIRDMVGRKKIKLLRKNNNNDIRMLLSEIIDLTAGMKNGSFEEKYRAVYEVLGRFSDRLLHDYLTSIVNGVSEGDLWRLIRAVSGVVPAVFLSLPFISTINVMNESHTLQEELGLKFGIEGKGRRKRIAWFTDTFTDLNGPSETIQKLSWQAFYQDFDLVPVVCLLPEEKRTLLPPNVLDLPSVWTYTPPFFSLYTLRVPSILASLKKIVDLEPDEIMISTPGPVGLLGLLLAKLLHIPCKGVYHTDFTEQAACITQDDTVCRIMEEYTRWFYNACDEIKVPTREYIRILSERNFPERKMSLFGRGIESDLFAPQPDAPAELEKRYSIPAGTVKLLCVGRISQEKQLENVLWIYDEVLKKHTDVSLIFAGNGPEPYFSEFRKKASKYPGVFFLGRIKRCHLPVIYSGSGMLLFPSTTDTFGMAVLEAQACGLPALVSDIGGPQEIILDEITGYVLPALNVKAWSSKIGLMIGMMRDFPDRYFGMRTTAREHVLDVYDWQRLLEDIFGMYSVKNGVAPVTISDNNGDSCSSCLEPGAVNGYR